MITVEAGGQNYSNLISVEMGSSLDSLAGDFSFTLAQPENKQLPFKGGEPVKIFIDGFLRLDGAIDEVNTISTKKAHNVVMTGRSAVADLLDSTLLPLSIDSDISLQKVIEFVLDQIGLEVFVLNEVADLTDFKSSEDQISAEAGEGCFAFIDKLARKKQVLLTGDSFGNIVITRNGTEQNKQALINQIGLGNMVSSSVSYNLTKRFNRYTVMSQGNGASTSLQKFFDAKSFVNQQGSQTDDKIRTSRQKVIQAEKSTANENAAQRATWEANIARANSRKYSVTVRGVKPKDGKVWEFNRLQEVRDDTAGINEVMLIKSVRFLQSKAGGTITKLGLVDKDAYSVALEEPTIEKKESNSLVAFF